MRYRSLIRMLCCPIRSPFKGSRRFPGGVKSSRNSDAKCSIPNRRRAAASMLTKRATRSLWNNRSVSEQRNDRITLSEYYALRKAYNSYRRSPPLPAQFGRRETDVAIENHLHRRAFEQRRVRALLEEDRGQAHRRARRAADADALQGMPRCRSDQSAQRGAHDGGAGNFPQVAACIPFARDLTL